MVQGGKLKKRQKLRTGMKEEEGNEWLETKEKRTEGSERRKK